MMDFVKSYGLPLVGCVVLATVIWRCGSAVWKQFILPMRDREIKFVDEVAAGLATERETTRESLQTISSGIKAIEGYAKSSVESSAELKSQVNQHHEITKELLKMRDGDN